MRRPGGWCVRLRGLTGRRLSGGIGKSAEGLGVAHGDVGQDLAVQLDAGELQAVDERAVAHAVLAGGGVVLMRTIHRRRKSRLRLRRSRYAYASAFMTASLARL